MRSVVRWASLGGCREERRPSPWRDRAAAESLTLFEDMRRGLVNEGQATLRWLITLLIIRITMIIVMIVVVVMI